MSCRQEMKVLSLVVKYLPPLISLMYFINSVLSLCDIYISYITFFCSCGFLPLFIIYLCCKILKYCIYYKAYLAYIAISNLLNWIDYIYGFTEDVLIGWIVITGLFFLLITYLIIAHIIKIINLDKIL